jgi:hypothetical protein
LIELGFGGRKRVVRINDDLSISLEKNNGNVIASYSPVDIAGIAYVFPTFFVGGRMAICTTYADSKATTWSSIFDIKDSFDINKEDKGAVETLLNWFDNHKVESSALTEEAQVAITAGTPDLPLSFLSAWRSRYGEQLFWVSPPFLGQADNVVDVLCQHPGLPSLILTSTHLHQCDYSGKDSGAKWKRSTSAPLIDITNVEVKELGLGIVQLKARLRGSAAQSKSIYGTNIVAGDLGPHSIADADEGRAFAKSVNAEIAKHLQPATANQPPIAKESSIADELFKLKGLLDAGAISQSEFDSLKAKMLS